MQGARKPRTVEPGAWTSGFIEDQAVALGKGLCMKSESSGRRKRCSVLELMGTKYFEVFALRFESTTFSDIFFIIIFSKYLFVIKSFVMKTHADFEK